MQSSEPREAVHENCARIENFKLHCSAIYADQTLPMSTYHAPASPDYSYRLRLGSQATQDGSMTFDELNAMLSLERKRTTQIVCYDRHAEGRLACTRRHLFVLWKMDRLDTTHRLHADSSFGSFCNTCL